MKTFLLLLISVLLLAQPDREGLIRIEKDAIVFGTGLNHVYVFADPLCPNSRNYIDMINTTPALLRHNTYYVFLYHLNMFDSEKVIASIYMSRNPKKSLLKAIVNAFSIPIKRANAKVERKFRRIHSVASKIGMTKRPYVIMYDNVTGFCKVSEGEASCKASI